MACEVELESNLKSNPKLAPQGAYNSSMVQIAEGYTHEAAKAKAKTNVCQVNKVHTLTSSVDVKMDSCQPAAHKG